MVLLRFWLLLLYSSVISGLKRPGQCKEPPTARNSIVEMCSNDNRTAIGTEWHLYPVDYQPYEPSGSRTVTFFRTGGINWRCIDLAVRCTTATQLQLTLSCRQVTAVFTVDLIKTHFNYRDGDRCCGIKIKLRPGVKTLGNGACLQLQLGYELWGHASRALFVQMCHNIVEKRSHVNGYWLFVSQNSDTSETRRTLRALLKHYPYMRLHSWTTALANKDGCQCAFFDSYITRMMQCNAPMYDPYRDNSTEVDSRMDMGLRLVDVKSIHIVIPRSVVYIVEGVIVIQGIVYCVYILLMRGNSVFEV